MTLNLKRPARQLAGPALLAALLLAGCNKNEK